MSGFLSELAQRAWKNETQAFLFHETDGLRKPAFARCLFGA
jgi:hypothetical protein